MQTIFDLDNIGLSLPVSGGDRTILRDITFAVTQGEILTIVGASGTGKTSLLRLLAGLNRQSSGTLKFRGTPIDGPQDGVAIVFQDYTNALLQWRTVANNVALGLPRKLDRAARAGRILSLIHI